MMCAYNSTRETWLATDLRVADTLLRRTLGLIGKARLAPTEGLWIKPCNSIHTMGMRFSIDVAFLDRHGQVVKIVERLRPLRLVLPVRAAVSVVELPAGAVAKTGTRVGDRISIMETRRVAPEAQASGLGPKDWTASAEIQPDDWREGDVSNEEGAAASALIDPFPAQIWQPGGQR